MPDIKSDQLPTALHHINHEFKAQLTSMQAQIFILRRKTDISAETKKELLEEIDKEIILLSKLFDTIITVVLLELEKNTGEKQNVSFDKLIESLTEIAGPSVMSFAAKNPSKIKLSLPIATFQWFLKTITEYLQATHQHLVGLKITHNQKMKNLTLRFTFSLPDTTRQRVDLCKFYEFALEEMVRKMGMKSQFKQKTHETIFSIDIATL